MTLNQITCDKRNLRMLLLKTVQRSEMAALSSVSKLLAITYEHLDQILQELREIGTTNRKTLYSFSK